jgi:ferritin-like metal-binding protein YciE
MIAKSSNQHTTGKNKGIMKPHTLRAFYLNELRHLYDAENQLVKALPKLARGASSKALKKAIETHLEQTKGHIKRLDEVFALIEEKAKGKICHGMKGLIEEGSEVLQEEGKGAALDIGIIAVAQMFERYEIGAYGVAITFAQLFGQDEAVRLLQETLAEETETNGLLNHLAQDIVNPTALMGTKLAIAGWRR